jgi:hypothetical protein
VLKRNSNTFLPSKKFILIVISLIITVAVVSSAFYLPSIVKKYSSIFPSSNKTATTTDKISLTENIQKIDSDNDGLPDWEEILWKTDPQNPDTDGDGVSDGKEVETGHSPTTKGPDDLFNQISGSSQAASSSSVQEPKTETERIARDFFSKYLQLKTDSTTISDSDKASLIKSILNESLSTSTNNYKTFTKKDLYIISGQITSKMYSDYKDNVVTAFNNAAKINPVRPKEGEVVILERAFSNLDASELTKLNPIIKEYKALVTNLSKVSVPNNLVTEHLNLLNSISGVSESIQFMKNNFDDPIVALRASKDYENFAISMDTSFGILSDKIFALIK